MFGTCAELTEIMKRVRGNESAVRKNQKRNARKF